MLSSLIRPNKLRRSLGVLSLLWGFVCSPPVAAQSLPDSTVKQQLKPAAEWQLIADGRLQDWSPARQWPVDSLHVAAQAAVQQLQQDGHYFAQIDSAQVDTSQTPPVVHLYATSGPEVEIGAVRIEGAAAIDSLTLLAMMDTRPGRTLDPARLETDLEVLLLRYEREGLPLVQARIADIALMPGDPPRLAVLIHIDEGLALRLQRVEVPGAERTKAAYVARIAELGIGRPLLGYDPAAIQQRLEATAYFRNVGVPELYIEGDSVAIIRIPLDEEPPGAFDLVLGYLPPPPGGDGGGNLIGNGHLNLSNLFGAGRHLSLKLNRLPGEVSSVDVRAGDPFLLGLPLRAEARFAGLQQDSTYGKQEYGLEIGYFFNRVLEVFGTGSREVTRPSQAGERIVGGRQRIARAEALFLGIGLRIQRIDRRINPRRGYFFETNVEQGRKTRTAARITAEQDTTTERIGLRQERLRAQARLYLPTFTRQLVVLGGETAMLLGEEGEFDESDFFRLGGATSLRGYNEEQFRGRVVARALVEYRYQIDRSSYAALFFDLGYHERPQFVDPDTDRVIVAQRAFHPGFGVGFQVGTDIGLINLSLAANPDDATGLRAHLGLSIGL